MFSLAWLCFLRWPHHGPAQSVAVRRTPLQRLLKPRSPHDCPACRLSCTLSSGVEPVPPPVRPWREVKSRRGAPKRVNTDGFACPNHQCPYSGITDAHVHALVGDGTHGLAERIQTFRCQACHTTFSARRDTPLYRLKTPSRQVAVALTALAEGLDASAAERVFGYRQATITTWLTRAGEHAQTLHERSFCHLWLPHLQLDELRTRLRSYKQVLWLWLAIDPCTKLLPVLHLGPRSQNMAHTVIHCLRQILAPGCLPLFTSDGLNLYFYASPGPFRTLARGGSSRAERAPVAGGDGPDLRAGEEKLPAAQAAAGHARDAPGNTGRSHPRPAGDGLLWTAERRFYRASQSDGAPWGGSTGSPHMGHSSAVPTTAGTSGMVASLLSFCAAPYIVTDGARAATRARGQAGGATLPPAYSSHGSGKNQSTVVGARRALLPIAASFRLRAT